MSKRPYDSTVARIAGNILSGLTRVDDAKDYKAVEWAVQVARAVVAEVKRTEPEIVNENADVSPQALPRGPA